MKSHWASIGPLLLGSFVSTASAVQVEGDIDVDNYHALYTGNHSGSFLTLWGQGRGPWSATGFGPTHYDFASERACIFIAAWSDDSTVQGLLHDLRVEGIPAWFGQVTWDVYPTAEDRDALMPVPTVQEVMTQISLANTVDGWTSMTVGKPNDGSFPGCPAGTFTPTPGVDSAARWGWFDSGRDEQPCAPFAEGFDHDEFLIFRFCEDAPISVDTATWGGVKATYR